MITSEKKFKVKLIFPVTSLTWRETSNTFCVMEWHKASLWAVADGFDREHWARKLVLSSRRLTRRTPLFQCAAWQPTFCWWGPNKGWHGVTPVHACWQPPNANPLPREPPPQPPCLGHQPAPFMAEAHTSLHIEPKFDCYHGRPLLVSDGLNDSIYLIKYRGGRGMLRMGLGSDREGWSVCVCGVEVVVFYSKKNCN